MTKQDIRDKLLAQREQLSPDLRTAKSVAISERLQLLPQYRQASTILGYMNFGAEFISSHWVKQVLGDGKHLILPKVNHRTKQLDLYRVSDMESQLAAGSWDILEPIIERCERLNSLNEVEFVLLPGVAFSRDGARLGYGGGFYDKLLAGVTHRPALVAAAFSLQIIEQIPQEATDIKVEWIITEQEAISCSVQE